METDWSSYVPALGFSVIFLIMLKYVWDYFVGRIKEWEAKFDAMLRDQQARFDALNAKYQEDLRDWSGLNPRPQTWLSESSPVWKRSQYGYDKSDPEGPTRKFPQIPEQERAEWVKQNSEG